MDGIKVKEWKSGTTYRMSDVVDYDGKLYQCTMSHTAIPPWNPQGANALWRHYLTSEEKLMIEKARLKEEQKESCLTSLEDLPSYDDCVPPQKHSTETKEEQKGFFGKLIQKIKRVCF